MMCPDSEGNKKPEGAPPPVVNFNGVADGLVLLATLLVKMKTSRGDQAVRVLLDHGSQKSYIRARIAQDSNSPVVNSRWERNAVFGGGVTEVEKKNIYQVRVKGWRGRHWKKLDLADKSRIVGEIPRIPQGSWQNELKNRGIWLSDLQSTSNEIDILIGADFLPQVLTGHSFKLDCGLIALETVLGWTLMGPIGETSTAMAVTTTILQNSSLSQLWDLETLGIKDPAEVKTVQEREIEVKQHFMKTLSRNPDGRYCVRLPWVNGVQKIPDNRCVAQKRLESATAKLVRDNKFQIYDDVFKSWEKEGIVEQVCGDDVAACHYIPHRPVYKPESKTTPVRPVFDASCKVGRNPSLNECLEKGPNLIELIPSVMLRFRENRIGVVSDIRKAFQMVEVSRQDQNFLRFLWWEDETCKIIKIYRHKRVVFGVNCSPFLLGAVLENHLTSVRPEDKKVALKMLTSLYVDNCVTSVESYEEYEKFKGNATRIMKDAEMDLREWECGASGESGVGLNQGCGLGYGAEPILNFQKNPTTMVLGMVWDRQQDTLSCDAVPEMPDKLTKRSLLSTLQQIFDPMGYLSPAMILPKRMLQQSWAQKLEWDKEIPLEVRDQFLAWVQELKFLAEIKIPRRMSHINAINKQIHVFSDASQHAYAAMVFLRVQSEEDVSVQLLQSKARVSPMKKVTIPRLELMGCVIAARLGTTVKDALNLDKAIPTTFWCDSTTALAWIQRNDEWGTFVGNRVKEICTLVDIGEWRHVPGVLNPADLPSRGCTPKELLESKWWEGPHWLKLQPSEWPKHSDKDPDDEDAIHAEKRRITVPAAANVTNFEIPWFAQKFSPFLSSVRVVAWMNRFIAKSRRQPTETGELTSEEVDSAELFICKFIQNEAFLEKADILGGIQVLKGEDGLFRAKTKLLHRQDDTAFKLPIVLPHSHPMVERLIREEHLKNCHAGNQFLMSKLRERYWIIQSRKAIRKVTQSCVTCRRFRAKVATVPAAPLPENRVKDARAFEVTGVDLAGPLYLKSGTKVWIVLFTCGVYRGLHLELVSSLSTDTFLLALFRFMSRRGRPAFIYSDNGTNFVGVSNLFDTLDWSKIQRDTKIHRIQWRFNPPSAPWWGGWWERLVGLLKDLLRKMLEHKKLNLVQLETCLCEVEAVLNQRPLTVVTEDAEDLILLTPAMFMQDMTQTESPDEEVNILNAVGFRKKYKDLVQLKQELRMRFRTEYLSLLVHKGKSKPVKMFQVGDVVLIASEDKKRMDWPMGRILELMPGKDGQIRVARIKTAGGELIRPMQRLLPLEVDDDSQIQETVVKKEIITRSGRKVKKPERFGEQ